MPLAYLGQTSTSSAVTAPVTGFASVTGYTGLVRTQSGGVANVTLSLQDLANGFSTATNRTVAADIAFSSSGYMQNTLQMINGGLLEFDPAARSWVLNTQNPVPPSAAQGAQYAAGFEASPVATAGALPPGVVSPSPAAQLPSSTSVASVAGPVSSQPSLIANMPSWIWLAAGGLVLLLLARK